MNKKYRLTEDRIFHNGHVLYRIQAIKDFRDIRRGDLGGYIESERNLSQDGLCWLYDNSKCYEHGFVDEDSKAYDEAEVFGEGLVCEDAIVKNKVKICGTATVEADAVVSGSGIIKSGMIEENKEIVSKAVFIPGPEFNEKINTWFGYYTIRHDIGRFLRAESLNDTSDTKIVSDKGSDCLIYVWLKADTLYWYSEADKIFFNEDSSDMFYYFKSCYNFDSLKDVDVSLVKNMSRMFEDCASMKSLKPLENWITGNVTDMSSMFALCSNLDSIGSLENWITSNVIDMSSMFYECSNLISLEPLKNWDTRRVTDMSCMFCNCRGLENVSAIEAWDISIISTKNFCFMFASCPAYPHWDGTWDDNGTFIPKRK